MEWKHGKIMVAPEALNTALAEADEAAVRLSQELARPRPDLYEVEVAAAVAQAREARALRLTLAMCADVHEDNADRRADR